MFKVSGVRFQVSVNIESWHLVWNNAKMARFLFRSDWSLAARGGAYMKLRLSETVKRLNVEHRTSNIEHRILMALRFIDFKTSESRW